MRPKRSANELEKGLRESRPPATAVPPHFRQKLRQDLQAQATHGTSSPLSRGWLLAPVVLLTLVIVAFWYGWPKTAVEPAIEINTTRPAATTTPSSTSLSREEVLNVALRFASRKDNKPIGGWLVEPRVDAITVRANLEAYTVAVNRLGSFAVADFEGSNIIFPENETETVWFVQLVGDWQPWGEPVEPIEPSRYVGVLVHPDTGQIVGAGSSTVPFLTEPIILSMASYPPQERPYFVEEAGGFWLVHAGSQLLAFDSRAPIRGDWPITQPRPERCLYTWVETNGRFTDPCSGDEWELDGRLNLAESTELWSNRNLDQYRVELEDGDIIVHLDEIIFGEVVAPVSALGTLEQPQTDFDIIIGRIDILASRQQVFLTSQSGWFYMSFEEYRPLEYRDDSEMMRALFPTEQMVYESWYDVAEDGRYAQLVGRYLDADGNQTQASIFASGNYVNLTFNEIMPAAEFVAVPNETRQLVRELREMRNHAANTPSASAYIVEEDGHFRYYVRVTTSYAQPIRTGTDSSGQLIIGDEIRYVIDLDSGRLLSKEVVGMTAGGETIVNSHINYLAAEWVTDLPEAATELLAQGQWLLQNPAQADGTYTWDAPTPTPDSNPQPMLASDTAHGITVSVRQVTTDRTTQVSLLAQVDRHWEMQVNAFPPQQALIFTSTLHNEQDEPFTLVTAAGQLPEVDAATGGLKQETVHTFTGDVTRAEELVLQTAVDLSSLHRVITLPLSLDGAQVGQTWPLDWHLPVGGAQLQVTEVTWISETTDGEVQLQMQVVDNSPSGLNIYCVHVAITDPWQETCANFEGEKTYFITVPPDAPIVLHLRVSLLVSGFELRWRP